MFKHEKTRKENIRLARFLRHVSMCAGWISCYSHLHLNVQIGQVHLSIKAQEVTKENLVILHVLHLNALKSSECLNLKGIKTIDKRSRGRNSARSGQWQIHQLSLASFICWPQAIGQSLLSSPEHYNIYNTKHSRRRTKACISIYEIFKPRSWLIPFGTEFLYFWV